MTVELELNETCDECAEFARDYSFNSWGTVRDPGKFEGEPIETYHAYHQVMDGFEDASLDDVDGTEYVLIGTAIMYVSDSGFVNAQHFDTIEEANAKFGEMCEALDAELAGEDYS